MEQLVNLICTLKESYLSDNSFPPRYITLLKDNILLLIQRPHMLVFIRN